MRIIGWIIVTAVCVLLIAQCSLAVSKDDAKCRRALEANGFTVISIGEPYIPWFKGGEADAAAYDCRVKNAKGDVVTVTVYMGWLKDATIRVH